MHSHIIYYTTYKNIIIYIGCGLPNRNKHTTSGISHVYDLNRLHFTDPDNVQTTILRGCVSEQEALELEKELIFKFKPSCNSQYLSTQDRYSLHKDEIQEYASEYMPLPGNKELSKTYNLSGVDKLKLGKVASFKDVCLDYIKALENKDKETIEFIEEYDDIFKVAKKEFGAEVGDHLSAISYQRCRLATRLDIQQVTSSLIMKEKIVNSFHIGGVYTKEDIKKTIQDIYNEAEVKKTATATAIQQFFEVKATKNHKFENCFKIVEKL